MSVPPDRMAARTSGTIKDPNKIMGLPKWAFFSIIALGLVLAYYLYKKSQSSSDLNNAAAGTTEGVTAADIGGTPADNSFATQTDEQALEEQIQGLQNSLAQLQAAAPGVTGAGVGPGSVGDNSNPGNQPDGSNTSPFSSVAVESISPTGGGAAVTGFPVAITRPESFPGQASGGLPGFRSPVRVPG